MGGIETMLVNITRHQALRGHNVHIVIINDIIDPSLMERLSRDVQVHRLGRKVGSKNPWHVLQLNRRLLGIKPDIVHLHIAGISKYIFAPSLKSRLCNTLHSICTTQNTVGISKAGPIFAISNVVRDDLYQAKGLSSTVVRNGIEPFGISPRPYRKITGTAQLVQVGRLDTRVKGQDTLLHALAKVKSHGEDVHLTLIGDGPAKEMLQKLANELGITANVTFLGNKTQDYIFNHLADYDIMVHPSRIEGFGLVIAEGMAAMLPVVVTDNAGPLEIIDGGRYGYHFTVEDAEACAQKIIEVIRNYPSHQFLQQARNRIITEFNVENTAENYLNLYHDIAGL